eukprot:7349399-Prymnesium_polylepis.2
MEFFHPMFTRNGVRNLKDIKRGNQMKKQARDRCRRRCRGGRCLWALAPRVCKCRRPPSALSALSGAESSLPLGFGSPCVYVPPSAVRLE